MKKVIVFCFLFFTFITQLKAEEIKTINFYDEQGNLIVSYELVVGEIFQVPTIRKEGYNFLGFNTQKDGSGEYLYTYIVSDSKNYYAIYEVIYFNVEYYVLGQLYYQTMVAYGEDAPNIEVMVDDKEFLGWSGLNHIQSNTQVSAQFKDKDLIGQPEMTLVKRYEESDDVEEADWKGNAKEKENEVVVKEIRGKKDGEVQYIFYIVGGAVVLFMVFRTTKKIFSKRK